MAEKDNLSVSELSIEYSYSWRSPNPSSIIICNARICSAFFLLMKYQRSSLCVIKLGASRDDKAVVQIPCWLSETESVVAFGILNDEPAICRDIRIRMILPVYRSSYWQMATIFQRKWLTFCLFCGTINLDMCKKGFGKRRPIFP